VPERKRVDITAIGHACAASASSTLRTRLALEWDGDVLVERAIEATGDAPTTRMSLGYEHALADEEHNPIGSATPSLRDTREPTYPGSFGPVASVWPCRSRLVGGVGPPPGWSMHLPDAFDWHYFQAAPPAQGFHPDRPVQALVLPGLRAQGVLFDGDAAVALDFRADSLHVDADASVVTLSWRAVHVGTAHKPLVAGGVAIAGERLALPARRPHR
jgi:hypothetical protein